MPDLDDPATLGCLLHLVREAWACPALHTDNDLMASRLTLDDGRDDGRDEWWMAIPLAYGSDVWACNSTFPGGHAEAEALVAALEAAP